MEKVNNVIDKLAQDMDSKSNVLKACYMTLKIIIMQFHILKKYGRGF